MQKVSVKKPKKVIKKDYRNNPKEALKDIYDLYESGCDKDYWEIRAILEAALFSRFDKMDKEEPEHDPAPPGQIDIFSVGVE